MARHQQQTQSSSHWQKAGYEAGVELKRLRRSLTGAEQRLIQRAGVNARWMRFGLLLLKVLAAVALVATALAAFWVLIWIVLPAAVVMGGLMMGWGGGVRNSDPLDPFSSPCDGPMGRDGFRHGPDGYGHYMGGFRTDND